MHDYFGMDLDNMVGLNIFTLSAALLAFVLAFYALIARERKTPYITASIYSACLLILVTLAIAFLGEIIGTSTFSSWLKILSEWMYLFCLCFVFYRLWKIHNRHIYFRDDNLIKNTWVMRQWKSIRRSLSKTKDYEHKADNISENVLDGLCELDFLNREILDKYVAKNELNKSSMSIAINVRDRNNIDDYLCPLFRALIKSESWYQYMACGRHPMELMANLKEYCRINGNWENVSQKMIVIDAYTAHFGFTDSTYKEWHKNLSKNYAAGVVKSPATYAGIHTSTAKAFNLIKEKAKDKDTRKLTVVLYESPFSITDIESEEQYRIFLRHVIPSEKLWGGMVTIWIEYNLDDRHWDLLKSLTDMHYVLK